MSTTKAGSRNAFLFLQVTALLNAAGMGLVIPALPFLADRHVHDPTKLASAVGWMAASYSLCAFLSAPALGALSDRIGRRPVLLLSLAGSALGYFVSGFSGSLTLLLLGRIVDGLTAGNTGALFGYLGDTSSDEERAARFGRIGAISGAGFILGPAIGGLAVNLFGVKAPFFFAAGLALLNTVWGLVFLPESLAPENRAKAVAWVKLNPMSQLAGLFELGQLRRLLVVSALVMVALTCLPSTFPLMAKDCLAWGADKVSFVLILVGVTDILVQGLLLAPLQRIFGGGRILLIGLGLTLVAYVAIFVVAIHPSVPLFLVSIAGIAGGEGLFTASFSARLSAAAGPTAQGRVQGGNQALYQLATIVVPVAATQLYAHAGPASPYGFAAVVTMLAILLLPRDSPKMHRNEDV